MNHQTSWYRHWWGVPIAIVVLPLFALWYVWVELERSKVFRISATAFLLAVYAGGIMSLVYALPNSTPTRDLTAKHASKSSGAPGTAQVSNMVASSPTPTNPSTTLQSAPKASANTTTTNTTPPNQAQPTETSSVPSTSQPTTPAPATPTTPVTPTPPPKPTVTKSYQCWYTAGTEYNFYLYMVYVTYYSNGTQSSYQSEVGHNSNATGGFPQCPGNEAPLG